METNLNKTVTPRNKYYLIHSAPRISVQWVKSTVIIPRAPKLRTKNSFPQEPTNNNFLIPWSNLQQSVRAQ